MYTKELKMFLTSYLIDRTVADVIMKQYEITIILAAIMILLIPGVVYASHEPEPVEESQDCMFTAYLEKSWIKFQERPWVTGWVYNCDEGIQYQLKDTVYVRILDINGDIIEDDWKARKDTAKTQNNNPTKYIFNDNVYRGGSHGGTENTEDKVIYLRENQYFFYMPQIHSIDFEHRGIYQIELTYNNEVRTIWFAVLDPDKWYQDP